MTRRDHKINNNDRHSRYNVPYVRMIMVYSYDFFYFFHYLISICRVHAGDQPCDPI